MRVLGGWLCSVMTMGCSGFFLLLLALTQDVGRGQEENRLHRVLSNGVGIPVRVRRGAPVVARAMCAGLNLPPALVAGSRYRDQVAKFEVDKAKADKAARLAAAKVGVVVLLIYITIYISFRCVLSLLLPLPRGPPPPAGARGLAPEPRVAPLARAGSVAPEQVERPAKVAFMGIVQLLVCLPRQMDC